jgi:hypothetical protein
MTDPTTAEVEFHPKSTGTASTNAERQRRYRQRNAKRIACDCHERNERNALAVTPSVASAATDGDGATVLCAAQDKIEITFDDDGDAIITQTRWPDEQMIIVSRDNIPVFIDKLTDALGIPSFGRP